MYVYSQYTCIYTVHLVLPPDSLLFLSLSVPLSLLPSTLLISLFYSPSHPRCWDHAPPTPGAGMRPPTGRPTTLEIKTKVERLTEVRVGGGGGKEDGWREGGREGAALSLTWWKEGQKPSPMCPSHGTLLLCAPPLLCKHVSLALWPRLLLPATSGG